MLLVLFAQVARLAVAEHQKHLANVERFLVESTWLPASRGRILDRNGQVLAQDQTSWDVLLQYDAIYGSWARVQGRKAALKEVGRTAWLELSPSARDAAIDDHERDFQDVLDGIYAEIIAEGHLTPDEFAARLDAIMTRVEKQATSYRENRKDVMRKKYGGDAPIALIEKERAPSQLDAHVVLENVGPEVAFKFQKFGDAHPGTVSVEPSMKRVRLFDETKVTVSRAEFPTPIRSSKPMELTIDGVADHIVGYMRNVYAEDVEQRPFRTADGSEDLKGYREGRDHIGSRGVERTAEPVLRGTRGSSTLNLKTGEELRVDPVQGLDIELTIDIELQKRLHALLMPEVGLARLEQFHIGWEDDGTPKKGPLPVGTELKGAIVVIDVETGGILAAVSSPTLADGRAMSKEDRVREVPTMFRPFEGVYPPGSILKPLVHCAAAAEGVIAAGDRITCDGHFFKDRNDILRCHLYRPAEGRTGTHGSEDARGALSQSCNIFFYTLADRLGAERLVSWLRKFGLGERVDGGLAYERRATAAPDSTEPPKTVIVGEATGSVPSDTELAQMKAARDRVGSVLLGIGQGDMTWTPLQAANAYATLARGGVIVPPTIYRLMIDQRPRVDLHIPKWAIDECWEGLHGSLYDGGDAEHHAGTGHHLTLQGKRKENLFAGRFPGIDVWGKTGTATAPPYQIDLDGDGELERVQTDHAWFAGFVGPSGDKPRFALAVILEHGGSGGKVAGPVAAEVVRALAAEGYLSGRSGAEQRSKANAGKRGTSAR